MQESLQSLGLDLNDIQQLQPIMNIGTIGHVSHGKSTIVKMTSGKRPQQFSTEQVRNITIKLGYANAKIFCCSACDLYEAVPGNTKKHFCSACSKEAELRLHFSYVDSPGHESYMSTMLNGTAVMDAALLVIAANENIPQPQTKEHLIAAELMELSQGIVALNKLDLITKEQAKEAYKASRDFLDGTLFGNAPIVPVCANYAMNMDVLARSFCENFKIPTRDVHSEPRMIVIRSFDVSRSGAPAKEVKGGVAGGSLIKGILRVGCEIEVRPGLIFRERNEDTGNNEFYYKPLKTTVTSLFTERTSLTMAIPGGLIGLGTSLDPALTKQNRLVGQVIGLNLPDVYDELKLKYRLIREYNSKKPFTKSENILVNVHSSEIPAVIISIKKDKSIIVKLTQPVCVEMQEKVSISKSVNQRWRLCGFATIEKGKPISIIPETADHANMESVSTADDTTEPTTDTENN